MSNSPSPPSPSEWAPAEALYLKNRRIVGDVVKKYYRQYLFDDDVMQEAHLAFWHACCAYDPSRGSLYALAVRYILNEIRRLHMMANLQYRTPPAPLIPLDAQAMDGEGSPLREHNFYNGIDCGQDYTALAYYCFDHWTREQGGHRYKRFGELRQTMQTDETDTDTYRALPWAVDENGEVI